MMIQCLANMDVSHNKDEDYKYQPYTDDILFFCSDLSTFCSSYYLFLCNPLYYALSHSLLPNANYCSHVNYETSIS